MQFPEPLTEARLLRRYKRFLADVRLPDGTEVTAHCPNPGSMLSLIDGTEQRVWLSHSADPKRKLAWSLELLEVRGTSVCVNTQRPNRIAEEAVASGLIPTLSGYDTIRREVRYGEGSRVDLLLEGTGRRDHYVEVKSATMSREPGVIEFPDSVTKRGTKHLAELSKVCQQGHQATLLLLSPRSDGQVFSPARDVDPAWANALQAARDAGVDCVCYTCTVTASGIYAGNPIPVDMD